MPAHRKPSGACQQNRADRQPAVVPARQSGEGAAVPALPLPPGRALAATRRTWEAFWLSDVARAVDPHTDAHRLTRWITCVDEWHRALRLYRAGRLVEGSRGQPAVSPAWRLVSDLEEQLRHAEQALGLTPAARPRLGVVFGEAALTAADVNRLAEAATSSSDIEFTEWEDAPR